MSHAGVELVSMLSNKLKVYSPSKGRQEVPKRDILAKHHFFFTFYSTHSLLRHQSGCLLVTLQLGHVRTGTKTAVLTPAVL